SVSVLGAASAWSGALVGGGLDVAVSRGEPAWLGFAEASGGALVTGDLRLAAATGRAGVGDRVGALGLRAGAAAAPIWVSTGAGDRTVLVGGGVEARLRVPVSGGVRAVLAAGVDAFAVRSAYQVSATTTIDTPWVAPYAAAGVEITP